MPAAASTSANLVDPRGRDFTVAYRIKPRLGDASVSTNDPAIRATSTTSALALAKKVNVRGEEQTLEEAFKAHRVYEESCKTQQIFHDLVAPLVPFAVLGGYATALAYGQTGSGKTFTLSQCSSLLGEVLFEDIAARQTRGRAFSVELSSVELCGDDVLDLLDEGKKKVKIVQDADGRSLFEGANAPAVADQPALEAALHTAWSSRRTGATEWNEASSRSHAIFRLTIRNASDPNATPGVVQLVDLAGSERASVEAKNHSASRRGESASINKSLMTLKDCIRNRTLSDGLASMSRPPHVPFRSSPLTLALKEAFDLTTKQPTHTVFIATVSALERDVAASLNTLKYASQLLIAPRGASATIALGANSRPTILQWPNDKIIAYFEKKCGADLSQAHLIAPYENGATLARVPEQEFVDRIIKATQGKWGHLRARKVYIEWWGRVVDARTLQRKDDQAKWKEIVKQRKARELQDDLEAAAQA
ncbi:Kinesin-like protein [Ceraceosorus bombacis]|uniref:Kinesin-like protein n=1 Tax=Ceraceosorus bombacis TaxID=401625 RepID=A0A0P1B8L1_9BASI|nr:Kinesin-like protein [Ceraceosorus bombacis]